MNTNPQQVDKNKVSGIAPAIDWSKEEAKARRDMAKNKRDIERSYGTKNAQGEDE